MRTECERGATKTKEGQGLSKLAEFGPTWPTSGQIWPMSVDFGPDLVEVGPHLAKEAGVGQTRTRIGHTLGRDSAESDRFRPRVYQSRRHSSSDPHVGSKAAEARADRGRRSLTQRRARQKREEVTCDVSKIIRLDGPTKLNWLCKAGGGPAWAI